MVTVVPLGGAVISSWDRMVVISSSDILATVL